MCGDFALTTGRKGSSHLKPLGHLPYDRKGHRLPFCMYRVFQMKAIVSLEVSRSVLRQGSRFKLGCVSAGANLMRGCSVVAG